MDVGAWIRPDEEEDVKYSEYMRCSMQKFTHQMDGNGHAAEVIHHFDVKLKKSLYLIDKFLCDVNKIYSLGISRPNEVNEGDLTTTNKAIESVVDAWATFCRKQDTNGLVVPGTGFISLDPHTSDGNLDQVSEENDKPMNAARLGQYFASHENAKDVSTVCFLVLNE